MYEVNEGFGKMHSYTVHEPTGVCALITPWNYPLLMGVWKLAPALAAGNSVVFKPASNCVLSSIRLFEIFEEVGMPAGSCNLILNQAEQSEMSWQRTKMWIWLPLQVPQRLVSQL